MSARTTDPQTSHAAAKSIATSRLEKVILQACKMARRGLTQDELCALLPDLRMNSLTPRFAPLIDRGLLRVDGTRPGLSGREQRVLYYVR